VFIGIESAKTNERVGICIEEENLRDDMSIQELIFFLLGRIDEVSVNCLVEGA
jgi:hypothetical protein